jgi:Asp-tRNA(Asn)/Glu-tRNA(Gln) amidotransferase A subunit family amidase
MLNQVSIPMKWCDELPSSVSLIAKHGADHFLLEFMTMLFPVLQSEVKASRRINTTKSETRQQKPDTAEVAKEKVRPVE